MRQQPRTLSPNLVKGIVVGLCALLVAAWYCVAERRTAHAAVGDTVPQTVQKGVNFLTPDVVDWTRQNTCFACHRQGAPLYGLANAKSRGYAVDTSKTTGLGYIAQKVNDEQQPDGRWTHFGAFNYTKTSYAFFGMAGYDKFVGTEYSRSLVSAANWAVNNQVRSGPYGYWVEDHGSFPTTYGNVPVTARMMVGIVQARQRVDSATATLYQQRLDLAAVWLRANRGSIYSGGELPYTFHVAYALIGLKAAGIPNDDPDVILYRDRLLAATSQPTGRGWGYTAGHGADEFNTGITLYALGRAGVKPRTNQTVRSAIDWLRDQQVNVAGADKGFWRSSNFGSLDIPTTFAILGLSDFGELGVEMLLDGPDHQVISSNSAQPQTVTYRLLLLNDGAFDATDTYSLSVQGGLPGWSAAVEPASVTLPSGEASPVTLTVTAPAGLPEALPVEMTVVATSNTDPKISANVKVTTYTDPPPPSTGDPTQITFVEGANVTVNSRLTAQPLAARVKDATTNVVIRGPRKGVTTFYVAGIAVGTDVDADGDGVFRLDWVPGESWTAAGPQDLRAVYSGIDLPAPQADLLPSFVASTINLDLANQLPVLQTGGPYSVQEGASVALTAVGSNLGGGSATYAWDLDNDGTFETQGQSVSFSAAGVSGPGSYSVSAQVSSTSGRQAGAQTVVHVQNVPPALVRPSNQTAVEGSAASFDLGWLSDPGPDSPWTVNVDWGDRQPPVTLNPSSAGPLEKLPHAYADGGLYTVTLSVADKDGATDTKAFKVKVFNAPPNVTAAGDRSAEASITKSFDLGLFDDPGQADGPWAVDIDWGDGSAHTAFNASAPGALAAQPHAYAANGNYTVTVRVTDKDGGVGSATFRVAADHVAVVRHALSLQSGRVEGTIRQLLGEDGSLGGTSFITSDLKLPGVPSVRVDGSPAFNGTAEGAGATEPSGYQVRIYGSATLGGRLVTRTDPVELPPLSAPPAPTGTRDVLLRQAGQSLGDHATLRDLTLTGNAGQVAVPPGTYRSFSANSRTTLLLGVANSSRPAVYNFQDLRLNGAASLRLAGPVEINVANKVILDGSSVMGLESSPHWLKLDVAGETGAHEDAVAVRGGSTLHAIVRAPTGRITVGGNDSQLRGAVACDYLDVNGSSVLHLLTAADATKTENKPPVVNAGPDRTITLPSNEVNLDGAVTDDGLPAGGMLRASWGQVSGPASVVFGDAEAASTGATFSEPGTYVLRLTAEDSQFVGSDDVSVNVGLDNQAPVVNAGLDQEIFLPATAVTLGGVVFDDGLPAGGALGVTWGKMSGAGTVTFSNPNQPVTDAAFSAAGTYVLRLTATDSQLTSSAEVTVKVSAINQAPTVDAGLDQTVHLPGQANLRGIVSDDGLPAGSQLGLSWMKVSGPGAVTFTDDAAAETAATFSEPGSYLLRLSATDTQFTTTSDVVINVRPPNQPPTVTAGASQTITLPDAATLSGMVSDDGLPAGNTLAVSWAKVSGPGEVTFGNSGQAATTAAFSQPGAYVLRLTADDSLLSGSADVTVTVNPAPPTNQAPAVNAGPDQTLTLPGHAELNGTASDDGLPEDSTVVTAWSKLSGPGTVTFTDPASGVTTAAFSALGTYLLRLTATDSELTSTDEIVVTVKEAPPANKPPTVDAGPAQTVTLPRAANLVGAVSDDGLPEGGSISVQWSKVSGPGAVTFSAPDRVTTSATFSEAGAYVLRLTAGDSELSASADATITVNGPNQPPTVNAGPDQTGIERAPVALRGEVGDDGLPTGVQLQVTWSPVSGPGVVTFADAHQAATSATFSAAGAYVLRLTASDSELAMSDEVSVTVEAAPPPPVVSIDSPADGSSITAQTNFVGTVSSGRWRLEYASNSSAQQVWTTFAAGSAPVMNGLLATFDPSLLLNGSYTFRLVATDAAGQTSATTFTALIDGDLKAGLFTIGFTDLDVPVAGLPIQVLRTYDSRDKRPGDFGVGWSLGIRNVRLEKTGPLGSDWEGTTTGGFFPTYCLAPRARKIVTATFPDGAVYAFQLGASPQCRFLVPIEFTRLTYTQLPGPSYLSGATLVPLGGDEGVFYGGSAPGTGDLIGEDSLGLYDPTRFQLTTADGISYVIDERGGVQSIRDTNGNTLTISDAGVVHSSGKSIAFTRDAERRITRITDPAGHSLSYTYNANGDLVSTTDRDGRTTRFTYNSAHGLLDITDPLNRRGVRNEYDASGRLLSVTDEAGKSVRFAFDPNSRQQVVTDRKGNVTVYECDERGRVLSATDADGHITRATYDQAGNRITHTDQFGNTTVYTYDARGNVLTRTDAQNRITRLAYNERGQVVSLTDANGNTTANTYDANGNLTSTTNAAGHTVTFTHNAAGQVLTHTDAAGRAASFEYDADGNLMKETDRNGHVTRHTYDANGNRTSVTDPKGNTTRFSYDASGLLTETVDPLGHATRREYDAVGNLSASIDELGRRTTVTSDFRGMLSQTTRPDGTQFSLRYDANGQVAGSTTTGGPSPTVDYSRVNLPTKVNVAPGLSLGYQYDAAGRLTSQSDPLGRATTFQYNLLDKVTLATDALGHQTRYAYDTVGNLVSQTDANGNTTTYAYDALNRLVRTTLADGSFFENAYDALGQLTSRRDVTGNVTTFAYDNEGRLLSVTQPGGSVTRYEYDADGNLTSTTDAKGRKTVSEYDQLGRLVKRTFPDGTTELTGYDAAGSVTSTTDRKGNNTTYQRDDMRRITLVRYGDGRTVSYSYTPTGKRDTITDARGVTDFDYDSLDRPTAVRYPDGTTVGYAYDLAGNRTSITTPDGTTRYAYDQNNQLVRVIDPRGLITSYTYDDAGNVVRVAHPNGLVTLKTYDRMNQLSSIKTVNATGTTVFQETYTRDAAGRRTRITQGDGSAVEYAYDALSRLTAETYKDASGNVWRGVGYTYDAVGNRLTLTDGGLTVSYTYNASDQLLSDGATAFAYDANGNNTSRTTAGLTTRYDYDARDRLTAVTQPDGSAITYAYDAAGNRVRTTDATGSVTNYVVDPTGAAPQVLVETDGAGRVVASYTYGLELISQRRGGADTFYLQDGLGSVRVLTDATGTVTDTYTYDAFGRLLVSTGATANAFRFAGEQNDADTGLYYLRARYYDPSAGRFAAMDPYQGSLGDPRTQHRYAYAQNDPVNLTDPTGLFTTEEGKELHRVLGAYYIGEWGDYWASRNRLKKSRAQYVKDVKVKPDGWEYGWGAYDRYVRFGFEGKGDPGSGRPDLRHYATGDVYEIKPLTSYGWQTAQDEAEYYVGWLNQDDREKGLIKGGSWDVGTLTFPTISVFRFKLTRMALTISYPISEAGTIYYMEIPQQEEVLAAGAALYIFRVSVMGMCSAALKGASILKAASVGAQGARVLAVSAPTEYALHGAWTAEKMRETARTGVTF